MRAPAIVTPPPRPPMVDVVCPVCSNAGFQRVILRAAPGSVVEVFCWKCKYRKVLRISC